MEKLPTVVLKAKMYLEGQKFKENGKIVKIEYEGIQKIYQFI